MSSDRSFTRCMIFTKFTSLAQVVPAPVQPYSTESQLKAPIIVLPAIGRSAKFVHNFCRYFSDCKLVLNFITQFIRIHQISASRIAPYVWYVKHYSCCYVCQVLFLLLGMSSIVLAVRYVKYCSCYQVCQVLFLLLGMSSIILVVRYVKYYSCYQVCQVLFLPLGMSSIVLAVRLIKYYSCCQVCQV